MKVARSIKVWLIGGALVIVSCNGGNDGVIATFQGGTVTSSEFGTRYKAYMEKVGQRDNIVLRKEILNNIINERLMFADLKRRGFEERAETKERLDQIRLQAILDRYSKRISIDTVTVSEKELQDEFRAYNIRASARYLYSPSEPEAWNLKRQLAEGETFERLARTVFQDPGLATNGGFLGSFGWGEMEPALEAAAFSLPIGEVSDPFPVGTGYGILKVETRVEQPLTSAYDYAKIKEKLRDTIVHRKTGRLLSEESRRFAQDASTGFNDAVLGKLFQHWNELTSQRFPESEDGRLEDISSLHLVTFKTGAWTVGDVVQRMERTSQSQRGRVKDVDDLKDLVTGLIVREELLSRALDADLEDDPQVTAQISAASYAFRLKAWKQMIQDSLEKQSWDDAILRKEYDEHRATHAWPPKVNVSEILVRTSEEASEVVHLLKSGREFASLARKRSIRLWAAAEGGELGFGTRSDFGILGEKFFGGKVGETIGPEFVDPYYGVFRILAYKEGRSKTFEEAREEIVRSLEGTRNMEAFKNGITALRTAADIQVDIEALANIVIDNQVRDQTL